MQSFRRSCAPMRSAPFDEDDGGNRISHLRGAANATARVAIRRLDHCIVLVQARFEYHKSRVTCVLDHYFSKGGAKEAEIGVT